MCCLQVVTEIPDMDSVPDLKYGNKEEQQKLLVAVLSQDDSAGASEDVKDDPYAVLAEDSERYKAAERKRGNLLALTGADSRAYAEFAARQAANKAKAKASEPPGKG